MKRRPPRKSSDKGSPEPGLPQPNNAHLWAQLSNAVSLRSAEDQILWAISGIFWAANALLLVALFQGGELPKDRAPGIAISVVGTVLCCIQYFLQGRTLGHIRRYEQLIDRLERNLKIDPCHAVSGYINTNDYERHLGGDRRHKVLAGTFFQVRALMQRTSIVGAFVWLCACVFFLARAVGWVK